MTVRSRLPTPDPTFIASRAVGDATVTVVSDGTILWSPRFPVTEAEWRRAEPDADADGRARFGLNVVLLRVGPARIVVDPAFDAPGSRFERTFAKWAGLIVKRSPGLDVGLALLDWDPANVTHVVVTHPHGDHIGGLVREHGGQFVLRFPNARHFLGQADWNDDAQDSELRRPLAEVARHGLLDLVSGEREFAPGATLVPAPGETPGHQVVCVESAGETACVLGDLVHHVSEVVNPDWVPPHADATRLRATRLALFPILARTGALVVVPHSPFPGWAHVVAAEDGFRLLPA